MWATMDRHDQLQARWQQARTTIIADYKLSGFEVELDRAMVLALSAYDNWCMEHRHNAAGLCTNGELDQLDRALRKCHALLLDQGIANRLELGAKHRPPTPEFHKKYGAPVFETTVHSRAQISGLLDVIEAARKIDGRLYNVLPRADLAAAAKPLREFWVSVAGRPDKRWHRGTHSPMIKFIAACLLCLDTKVSKNTLSRLTF
jgi:hypothetical protein